MSLRSFLTAVALLSTTGWAQYVLEDDYIADGKFFKMFDFFTAGDPTHGTVNYVDQTTANKTGLINFSNNQAYMGVDYTNLAPNGRASVRVTSRKSYDSGLVILDLAKMPGSICGTWPAFWMVGSNWPNNGEIDIIEGVNDQTTNDMTLHTSSGCSITTDSKMKGHMNTANCDVNAAGQSQNQGCQIGTGDTRTYGDGFNSAGGGVYATEWTSTAIKIYFFSRSEIPADITSGKPNPAGWGNPYATFAGGCNIPNHFKGLQIVFDTTFCGDWAGNVWGNSACASKASSCSAFVANNPSAFKDASWLVNSLKVYQAGTGVSAAFVASSSSVVVPAVTSAVVAQTSSVVTTTTSSTLVVVASSKPTTSSSAVVVVASSQATAAAPVLISTTTSTSATSAPTSTRHRKGDGRNRINYNVQTTPERSVRAARHLANHLENLLEKSW